MNFYRDILDHLPTAAIVLDKKRRVRYLSRAFRTYFPALGAKGTLKDVLGCKERSDCGEGQTCAFCGLGRLFADAERSGETILRNVPIRIGKEEITLSVRVRPFGKHLLGVIENAYESELARELHSAQDIQQRLLPPAKSGSVPYSFLFIPYREIGGDLPDVYEVGEETMGLLADVSGHGISAGMLSAFVKAGWDRTESSPAKALRGLNAKFRELNLDERSYVTVAAARIGRDAVHYCIAGHNAPLLLKSGQRIDEIEMSAPPISNWIEGFPYTDGEIEYRKGDILVLLTDGIPESRNGEGELFSLERVEEILQKSENAERFIEHLKAALAAFCNSYDDDITAIAFDL